MPCEYIKRHELEGGGKSGCNKGRKKPRISIVHMHLEATIDAASKLKVDPSDGNGPLPKVRSIVETSCDRHTISSERKFED